MGTIEVVLDSPTIVAALAQLGPASIVFPRVPPISGDAPVDALGVFAYIGDEYFAHILSDDIVREVSQTLTETIGWRFDETRETLALLYDQASDSGGGVVGPQRQISVPGNLVESTKTAVCTAAAKNLGHPRLVVTGDPAALRIAQIEPHGIPFPKGEVIRFMNPGSFARFAAQVRQTRRQAPPGR